MNNNNVSLVLLADGKSTRMGANKVELDINGKTQINRLIERLSEDFVNIIVVSNNPLEIEHPSVKLVSNFYPDNGPLAGIHSALKNTRTERNLFLTCDQPLVSKKLLNFLSFYDTDSSILVTSEMGKTQPFPGIYSIKLLKFITAVLETNKFTPGSSELLKMNTFIKALDAEIIEISHLPFYHSDLFLNINTQKDFEYFRSRMAMYS